MPEVVVLDLAGAGPELPARVAALQRASYALEAELIGFGAIPPRLETAEQVAGLDLTMLGAMEEGELVGILGYRRAGDVVDVDRVAVHPSALRRGVARALVGELHRREAGAARFEVSAAARNGPALALYRRMGYRRERAERKELGLEIVHLVRTGTGG